MDLLWQPNEQEEPVSGDERGQILTLTEKFVSHELSAEAKLFITTQILSVLLREMELIPSQTPILEPNQSFPPAHPPSESIHRVAVGFAYAII